MLGVKSEADPKRGAPAEGDKRVRVSLMQGKAAVVLYDAVVPGTPKEQRWEAVSPVGRTEFDSVRKVEDAGVDYQIILGDPANPKSVIGHVVEVSLPLQAIGLTIQPGTRIKFDWCILETDAQGAAVLGRTYWANKATSTLADAPTEARLEPDMWGWALFPGVNKESPSLADPGSMLNTGRPELDNLNLDGE
mgnify:FL=1